ncbi:putative spermidine/putrescine transport system permease protein [Bosea sp. AK1]|uniref:ABC transporter permease subunit n=1 Tax=Bosea sp. AK1 TaxID=2587160 RepID=UPI00114E3BE7|nr:ABC transporter permease subunit [Bosea sp. AK1]TQI75349.1 putative spermidine/putrescine transport system permease protein [Bosea sp. AK1]
MSGPVGSRSCRILGEATPLAPALILLLLVYAGPVVYFLASSFVASDGSIGVQNYIRLFGSATYVTTIGTTLKLAGMTTLLCILAGYPVAYLMATTRAGSSLILLVVLPFWTSYLVRTFAWIILLGRNGTINSTLISLGLIERPLELSYSFFAVITAMTHAMLPLAILTMLSTMQNIGMHYGRAASTLGARGAQSFLRVYLPLSMPGVAAAALMVFIICLGFFVNPALLGSRRETVITQIIIDQLSTSLDWGFAGAACVLMLTVSLAIVAIYQSLFGMTAVTGMESGRSRGSLRRSVSHLAIRVVGGIGQVLSGAGRIIEAAMAGVGFRPRPGGLRVPLAIIVGLIVAFLLVPVLFLIPVSFTTSSFMRWPPEFFTLRWYQTYLLHPIWVSAIVRSLLVGLGAAIIATAVGTPAAFALVRGRLPGKPALMSFIIVPMILPHMVLAIALFSLYAQIGLLGSAFGLIIAHAVLAIPLVVITVSSVLRNYDQRLDQAAAVLGARPLRVFRTVTLPLIGTGMVSAFIFSFISSFDELTVSLFVTGGLTATLPKQMWEDAINQVSPGLAAVSTVILLGLTLILLVVALYQRRAGSTAIELRG